MMIANNNINWQVREYEEKIVRLEKSVESQRKEIEELKETVKSLNGERQESKDREKSIFSLSYAITHLSVKESFIMHIYTTVLLLLVSGNLLLLKPTVFMLHD